MTCPYCPAGVRVLDGLQLDDRWTLLALWAPCTHLADAVVVLIDKTDLPRRTP